LATKLGGDCRAGKRLNYQVFIVIDDSESMSAFYFLALQILAVIGQAFNKLEVGKNSGYDFWR
jgi:midasin (ATPase involved in ribosome maturation)